MKMRFHLIVFILAILVGANACTGTNEKQDKQANAYRELAEAYFLEQQYTLALQELLKAEKLRPDDAIIQNDLGLVYMMKKRMGLSVQHFKKAIDIKPDYAEAMNNLATALLAMEEWDEAILYLKRLSDSMVYATPQYAQLNLAWAYFNKKNYDQAEAYYKQTLQHYEEGFSRDITYIKALGGLGRTYTATGRYADALKTLGQAIEQAPLIPDTYFYIGQAYEKAGRLKDAKMAYMKVIEVAPDSEIANKAARAAIRLK